MSSKFKKDSYNLKHPPFIATPPPPPPPSSSSSPSSLLNKQNKKMIKRSVTFEQSINSKSLLSSMTSTSSSSSSSSSSPISHCCTNLCNKQNTYTFSYLLRVNPPILPGDILNYLGFTKSTSATTTSTTTTTSTPILSRSNVNANSTGKVKVIICINQEYNNRNHNHNNQGLAITATTALNTIGSLLSSNNPLNTIHLKVNKNTCDFSSNSSSSSCIQIDENKRIITLLDPTPSRRRRGIGGVVRNYKFDNIVTQDTLKREFYTMVLNDALSAVLNGKDSCILTIGHKATGKTHSMIGYDYSPMECGIIPCGISWLYQLLNYQKQWYNTRFSIRISAVEITGLNEEFRDLLANTKASYDEEYSDKSPSHYLQTTNRPMQQKNSTSSSSSSSSSSFMNKISLGTNYEKAQTISAHMIDKLSHLCELRASTAEKAAYLLDTALSNRTVHNCNHLSGLSHMLFTLHLYQCKLENNSSEMSISGGRTKFHFLDLGCGRYGQHSIHVNKCVEAENNSNFNNHSKFNKNENTNNTTNSHSPTSSDSNNVSKFSTSEDSLSNCTTNLNQELKSIEYRTLSKALSLSGIGSVLLALLTGRRQLPYHDSSLTYLLREAITGNQIQPCILAHISENVQYYTETLQVIQLATEINRLRRRKIVINHIGTLTKDHELSLPLSLNASKSQEEIGSSTSNDTDTDFLRVNQSKHLHRRPRLGRLSYARSLGSCSSELDCTSSGEQSCDTVIYVGNNKLLQGERRLSDSRITSYSIKKLGPRGLADGSIDIMDKTHSCRGSSELIALNDETLKQHSMDQNQHTEFPNMNNLITIKRMIPRTNATVWPRIMNRTKSRKFLQSLTTATTTSSSSSPTSMKISEMITNNNRIEETWIDGPNVSLSLLIKQRNDIVNLSNYKDNSFMSEMNNSSNGSLLLSQPSLPLPPTPTPTPPPPPPPSYHNVVHNLIKDHIKTSFLSNTEELCEQMKEEPIINSIEAQNIHTTSMDKSIQYFNTTSTTSTTTTTTTTENHFSSNSMNSSFSTLDNNPTDNIPRALSDISECTEDAETIHESNSIKQSMINLSLKDELSTDLLTANLLTFDNLYTSCCQLSISSMLNEKQKNTDHNISNLSTMMNTTTTTTNNNNNNTRPTEVLLDIGRQIREASKCNNYTIPTSYVTTVNVPQYLNHLNEDEELMLNMSNTKSTVLNQEFVNQLKQPITIHDTVSTSNSENRISLSPSMKFIENNEANDKNISQPTIVPFNLSINDQCQQQSNQQDHCSHNQLKCQHLTRSRLNTPAVDRKLTNSLLHNSSNNDDNNNSYSINNHNVSTHITSNTVNNSLFRVAEWVSSISTPHSCQLIDFDNTINCSLCHNGYKKSNTNVNDITTNNTTTNDNTTNNHISSNNSYQCLNDSCSNMITIKNSIKSNLIKEKNYSNYSIHSITPSTLNDSAIGSLNYTKQNDSLMNSVYRLKLNEKLDNKQGVSLYK
ncbi:unnamed protein product [Schistosoma mattheei]|uniref:Kinesin motor domain-containing protein n=1 Tax=Schistosoma mattheei TaxID=31246 RepID=A0AA85BGM7_9TREM|nr:unnamed protein product [Schistosoma mattheei]